MLVFHLPISRSCPIASRHGQWPDPWAGVTECCSLLAGHQEITGGGEASIERGRSGESLGFQLLNRNVDQPFKYVATWLIDEWSKIGLHVTQRVVPDAPPGSTQCAAEISTYTTVALRWRRNAPTLRSTPDRRRMRSDNRTAIGSRRWPLQSPSSQSRGPLLFRAPWKGVLRWPRSRARGRPRMPPIYS
jgi:hypothetical protein